MEEIKTDNLGVKHEERVDEILRLTRQNNDMLRAIRSHQRWASVGQFLYYLVIIGITFGAFLFLQPYISKLINIYADFTSSINKVNSATNSISIPTLPNLDSLKSLLNKINTP